METFFRRLSSGNLVIIAPRVEVIQDGHPILVYRYDIFNANVNSIERKLSEKAALAESERAKDPDYVGVLTFEIPDKLFFYDFINEGILTTSDEQEIIALITDIRDNSAHWNFYSENSAGPEN